MSKSVLDHLLESLEDLDDRQLRMFTNKLVDFHHDIYGKDCGEVARKLIERFTEQGALRVTVQLLREVGCYQTAEDLEKGVGAGVVTTFHLQRCRIRNTSVIESSYITGPEDIKGMKFRKNLEPATVNKAVSSMQPPAFPEVFPPDMSVDNKGRSVYRFQCPHAGQFQCLLTDLVFEMQGKGEVRYGIEPWDPSQLHGFDQMRPAGPLYNIDCFEGPVGRLHLPHCEISSEAKCGLAVAHITKGNLEINDPVKVTNTHVIIAVQGLSCFGLGIPKIFSHRPIRAQVLLFYKLASQKRDLHILLLPRNVKLTEVQSQYKNFIHTSSKCKLTPGKKYRAICKPYQKPEEMVYKAEPEVEIFERDHDPNYHPAFVVEAEVEKVTVSLLDEEGSEVWTPRSCSLTDQSLNTDVTQTDSVAGVWTHAQAQAQAPSSNTKAVQADDLLQDENYTFLEKNHANLVRRVKNVVGIVDDLELSDEMVQNVQAEKTDQAKMRKVLDYTKSKRAAALLVKALKKHVPDVMEDLKA